MKNSYIIVSFLFLFTFVVMTTGCESDNSAPPGSGGDTDSDGDADGDGDTDGDGDSDSDSDEDCSGAVASNSYIGCDYWTSTFSNGGGELKEIFYFAVAVANNTSKDATITITDGAAVNNNYTVPSGQMTIIEDLPWKDAIKVPGSNPNFATRKVANAGYHINSSVPVTVYQFSPLHYKMVEDMGWPIGEMEQFSNTNDASLLLPAHIYRDEYVTMSRPSFKILDNSSQPPQSFDYPGFIGIVGVEGGPTVLEITTRAYTRASDGESNADYPAYSPGDTFETTIFPHEVLQILSGVSGNCMDESTCRGGTDRTCCNTPAEYDMTGTFIRVKSGPNPAVFGGHTCTFIPYDAFACDHVEQQMFPRKTMGQHYLCAHNITQKSGEPTFWRVMSASDDNEISFNPSSVHATVTLNMGEFIEFESKADFEVNGVKRVSVAQFMVGQNYTDPPPENGDPSMSMNVPVKQYRKSYTFLAPDNYVKTYLTVIHKNGEFPTLDGATVSGDTAGIAAGYSRTNATIKTGIHNMESSSAFGITVYGVGSYTSYMYPGGLDLKTINVPE